MTEHKTPAKPVANLAQARKEQAAARKAEAQSRAAHPAGRKVAPAAKAPAKAAKPEADKVTYAATGRGGVTRTQQSTSPLVAAVDVKIAGRKAAHFSKGAIVAFYASDASKAQAAADKINAGEAGPDWSDAIVVKVTPVSEQVSA